MNKAAHSKLKRYEQVVSQVVDLIDRGALKPGDKVPSVRSWNARDNVSVTTVLHAYGLLESRGYIEARPQSGYYVKWPERRACDRPKMAKPATKPLTVCISELVTKLVREARDPSLLQLGLITLDPSLLPNASLTRMMASRLRRMGDSANVSDCPPGNLSLRRQIARRAVGYGCTLSPEEIVVTSGGIEALNLSLRSVAKSGDIIAVESPAAFNILQGLESAGMTAWEIPSCSEQGVDLDVLENTIKRVKIKAVVVTSNFHNPLGSVMSDENKRRLVDILRPHQIPLIEYDSFGDLHFGLQRPIPAKAYDEDGLVLLCSTFSLTLAPGLDVGWVAPGRFQPDVEALKLVSTGGTSTIAQVSVAEFLASSTCENHFRSLRKKLALQVEQYLRAVEKCFPPGTRISRPTGGFVLWIEMPSSVDSLDFHQRAVEAGISICPGPLFSAKKAFRNCFRLSCGIPWSDGIEKAIFRLGKIATELAEK